ncbi:MAG: flavodoxin family protein [Rikenellaceae bacterium]|nr:flavodoxin family protein [Rikenellaceae bacterium]
MTRREALKYMILTGLGTLIPWLDIRADSLENTASVNGKKNEKNDIMKVLLLNGSPHKGGCTFTALSEIAGALKNDGVDSEIIHIADRPVSGCMGCGFCRKAGRCVVNDKVNELIDRLDEFDGFIFGSPVHYAAASGFITSFLDRLFYAAGKKMAYKPGAAVASCRRAGSTATLDQLNKYFTISNMPIVPSQYWNMVHGFTPDDVRKDEEGLQIMRTLGHNMAWMIKCFKAGGREGINPPESEPRVSTNFIK